MTEVLAISSDGNTHFGAPLRRSASSTSCLLQAPSSYARNTPSLKSRYASLGYTNPRHHPTSLPSSSAPSSPRLAAPTFSNQPSLTSTPSSSLSLDEQCPSTFDDDITFPSYNGADFLSEMRDPAPSSSPDASASITTSPTHDRFSAISFADEAEKACAGDDATIVHGPTRQVDYLSHTWKEEDIWASWRHIVTSKKEYSHSERLENAAWRTWAKSKFQLKTISPETLNWMKDHDVTWLYGPLQNGKLQQSATDSAPRRDNLSRSNSFVSKRPILKKRSLSEMMLQRSLSSSTLLRQAADAIRAQSSDRRPGRPGFVKRQSSEITTIFEFDTPLSRTNTNYSSTDPSTSSSGIQTPCTKRHIHFNNKVEQCIAINEESEEPPYRSHAILEDSESEDDMLVMKPVKKPTKAKLSRPNSPRGSFSSESKTIAMLPSTTLNYRSDTPEPGERTPRSSSVTSSPESKLKSSSSQQTIRPSDSSPNFLLDEDDDDDLDINWQPSSLRRGSTYPRNGKDADGFDEEDEPHDQGLRRTASGMFMPYDEEGDNYNNSGILGRVVDTVNTAKDIAHVIWNVGWRG